VDPGRIWENSPAKEKVRWPLAADPWSRQTHVFLQATKESVQMTIHRTITAAAAVLAITGASTTASLAATTAAGTTAAGTTAAGTTAAGTTAAGTTGGAVVAKTPIIGPEETLSTEIAPLTIPGTGVHKGARLPKGARLIYRQVTIEGSESVHFTMEAPAGKRFLGCVPTDDPPVGFRIDNTTNYAGHTKVWVSVSTHPRTTYAATGRLYGLVR
jgi:hypothetical protein